MSTLQRSGAPQAIQTRFKGYHFRSRTEARWAVFFDTLGLKWEYEKQGYDLTEVYCPGPLHARLYLPDFWVPCAGCWIEIKGALPDDHFLATQEESDMFALVNHTSSNGGFIFYGPPDFETKVSVFMRTDSGIDSSRDEGLIPFCRVDYELLQAAVDAAKSARFEHGESGRT